MRRRNFQCSGSEFFVHILVENDGNLAVDQWHQSLCSFQMGIALVVRMHTDSSIAQNGFRARGGNGNPFVVVARQLISNMEKL